MSARPPMWKIDPCSKENCYGSQEYFAGISCFCSTSETCFLLPSMVLVNLNRILHLILQLFGPRWNSEVPRFASNLGLSPLVPQKASASESNDSQHSYTFIEEPVSENRSEENNFQVVNFIQYA